MAFAHQADPPIVHGDLKPANVLVRRGPKREIYLRVTDFGIGGLAAERAAREVRQPTRSRQDLLTEAARGAYTPVYASPQQMARRPGEPADPRDDVHALGVIWYQLVTGNLGMLSVPTDWQRQLVKRGLDKPCLKLLASCISPQLEERPPSAASLAGRLRAILSVSEKPSKDSDSNSVATVVPAVPLYVVVEKPLVENRPELPPAAIPAAASARPASAPTPLPLMPYLLSSAGIAVSIFSGMMSAINPHLAASTLELSALFVIVALVLGLSGLHCAIRQKVGKIVATLGLIASLVVLILLTWVIIRAAEKPPIRQGLTHVPALLGIGRQT